MRKAGSGRDYECSHIRRTIMDGATVQGNANAGRTPVVCLPYPLLSMTFVVIVDDVTVHVAGDQNLFPWLDLHVLRS